MSLNNSHNERPLCDLLHRQHAAKVVVVGAGPSLDYCHHEIRENIEAGALFFLTDIVAANFTKSYPASQRVVFSVECRLHGYLKSLKNEEIAFYTGANRSNLPESGRRLYRFHFDFDEKSPDFTRQNLHQTSTRLVSPGTVAGAALAAALYLAKAGKKISQVDLLGIDFSYPEERVYSRLAYLPGDASSYFNRRETREYDSILARSSRVWMKHGFAVPTSEEFFRAKENFETLLLSIRGSVLDGLCVNDFSPLGLSAGVMKKIPHAMK